MLRILVTLVAEGNVSRTADRLGMSQPAASRALARLRVLFRDPLLLRSREGMVPTDRATEAARYIRSVIGELDRLMAEPEEFRPSETSRTFVFTAVESAEFVLLPGFLARVRAEAPNVRVEVRFPNPERSLEWLETGEIDMRVGWVYNPPSSLRSQALYRDQLVCIARTGHPEISGSISLAQFLNLPQVRPQYALRTTMERVIEKAISPLGGGLNIAARVQNYLTIPYMVASSDLIAALPGRVAADYAGRLPIQVLELPLKLPRMKTAAYWHERSHKDPGHQWLRRMLRNAAQHLR